MPWRVVERHIGRAGGLRQRAARQRDWDREDLEELIRLARVLRNPHAEATTGVDLQVPAILTYLERHGLRLRGTEVVDIGSWQGQASHPISVRLSPLHIRLAGDPKMTLEQFWQGKKCLAVWEGG
jgi:hypothetical protein